MLADVLGMSWNFELKCPGKIKKCPGMSWIVLEFLNNLISAIITSDFTSLSERICCTLIFDVAILEIVVLKCPGIFLNFS